MGCNTWLAFGTTPGRCWVSSIDQKIMEIRSRPTSDLAEHLVDRLAGGERTRPHFGIERHTQRMIEGSAEDLRWDRMVFHVSADFVGRAIYTPPPMLAPAS